MEPDYVLNRSYSEYATDCLEQWLAAYREIARKHRHLDLRAKQLTKRIRLAYSLQGGLANLGSTPDETAYAYRVEQERAFHQKARALDGDFPLGNEQEVFTARHLFSIREMAYIQAGLAGEIDPRDLSEVPRDKIYTIEDPSTMSDEELTTGRTQFLTEMTSKYPSQPNGKPSFGRRLTSLLGKIFLLTLLAGGTAHGQSLKIVFAGDLMGHMPQHNAALQPDGTYDYAPCFRYIKDYVKSADLAIVNLEVPLAGRPYSGYPQFSSPDALAACAKEAGFDLMTTANNHCMDRGRRGLERTLRALDSLGIPHLGTYRDRAQRDAEHPLMVDVKGLRLALLTYTYGTNGIPAVSPNIVNLIDTAEMARDLRVARDKGADFVITLIHWGIEYATKANREQEETARWLLTHGCDAVIGGHPHVVQNFTLDAIPGNDRNTEVVVYSLGNLVSNQRDVNTDGGIMVELQLTKVQHSSFIIQQQVQHSSFIIQHCKYLPYWVHRGTVDGLYQYYIVPSTDAVAYPDSYQIHGADLKALQLFDRNTRQRLEACRLRDGRNIEERQYYRRALPIHPQAGGVVPLRGNPALRERMDK